MIQTARRVNLSKTDWVLKKINTLVESKNIKDKSKIKIGCLGITFKPDVDDIRESPALRIVKKLHQFHTQLQNIFYQFFHQ